MSRRRARPARMKARASVAARAPALVFPDVTAPAVLEETVLEARALLTQALAEAHPDMPPELFVGHVPAFLLRAFFVAMAAARGLLVEQVDTLGCFRLQLSDFLAGMAPVDPGLLFTVLEALVSAPVRRGRTVVARTPLALALLEPEHLGFLHAALMAPADRRGRGAHYTPRSLTEPIVRKTLEPLLRCLGDDARPEAILGLRICDPACGGGAFLLELVRQLGRRLEAAWVRHGGPRGTMRARRLVAVHCAYGVDIDPVAVQVAKLALWLECEATGMPSSWLDDNVKVGDALVGLLEGQLASFSWSPRPTSSDVVLGRTVRDAITLGAEARRLRLEHLARRALDGVA